MHRSVRNIFIASLISASIITSAVFVSPAAALTVDDLQRQIQELLAKIAGLQEQLRVAVQNDGGGSGSDISVTAVPRICKILPERAIAIGARGEEVQGLQEFLRSEGYFGADATGFFGPVTRDALAKWQAAQGLPSVGSAGPMTRERLRAWCGGIPGQQFSASPTRGTAPLSVTFNTWLSGFRVPNISYTIDFGDGTSERAADCPAPADACTGPGQNTHTYRQDGTYTATLNKITDPCAGNPQCKAAIQSEVIGKVQIRVGGSIACTKEYRPVCGSKPVVCITAPCDPVQQTYGNRCMMEADGASYVHEGACRDDSGNRPPSVSSFSGPTTLSVNQSGTWTVRASDPENQHLTYSITWGDEKYQSSASGSGTVAATPAVSQTATFTHTYERAGSYTVTVIVSDASGKQSKATATVKVGAEATVCTMEYAPVCGRPTGCANTCPPGMYCAAICRLHDPVTYGNKCQLNASGAEYLHDGACTAASGNRY